MIITGAAKLALEDLEKVVNSPKSSAHQKSNALIKRGSLHMQNQENFRAMADFEQSVEVADESVDAHHHRGQVIFVWKLIKIVGSFIKKVFRAGGHRATDLKIFLQLRL